MSESVCWCFLGEPSVVLIFVYSIFEGSFHHLKTLQIIAGMPGLIFSITRASVSVRDRLLALWFPCTPPKKTRVLLLTMRGKQEEGERTHQILQRPRGEATQPKLLSLFSCETAAAFKAALRRDWQQLQLSLSFPLSLSVERAIWWETTRKEWKPPPPTSILLSQRERERHFLSSSSWWGDGCLLWVMCHYDSSTNRCYTGLWQMVEF